MSNKLFNEFDTVSAKQWKQKIQFDLKGADYNDTLVWKTNEDISVKPFYHADDFKELPEVSNTKTTWNICQSIFVADVKKSNEKAIDVIERGAESIKFIIPSETIAINDLLENINPVSTPLYFELLFLSEAFVKQLTTILSHKGIYIHTDIIGNLVKNGNWYNSLKDDFSKFKTIITHTKSLPINVSLYQNAGANMVQQLAYALAHANEYLSFFETNKNILPNLKITFHLSVGTNYFFEIAKLRALRMLWDTLATEYQANPDCHIMATPTKRNKTLYDYNTNLLRTTTECMSAILGGADSICNLPYDSIYHKDNEFGERIARNQLLVLKHESYFDVVNNPSDGTYYIESITNQLAEKALDLFKNIEKNGGFLKQLKTGTIQRKIKENAAKEDVQFKAGEAVLLGTNKHPNPEDKMKHELELYPFVKTNQRKTLIEPIIEKRLAEKKEQERLKNE
ncbi:methylmalonyl-CoA mutase subunit beta [Flavivirga aquimarina]|uniref:Methylmalonyl-CoA mutase subunit beta n=1 Tax=Flavivirga aquimarina TaxID=2027862 RepID=A0ABT8WEW1_9FLAO|nr:methylmalonyl-CoA mutase subunit beta [Flavivirga aquimarina]MDO5971699.1 methylmalonyl-CoA mutase subunit beta [Flavivirga aquimarina]